jgi:cation diffusion facilitator family transporter
MLEASMCLRMNIMRIEQRIDKLKQGEKTAGISTITIILLASVEALIGFLSGNLILIIDALHNAADSVASFASWFGLKISQRKPTERFPYGYYKAESLATLFVSIFILYAAFELLLEGYSKLYTVPKITMPLEALSIALVLAVGSYFLARYIKKTGETIDSQSLLANSKERLTHVFSSFIIFVGILLAFQKVPYVESLITMFFSFVIFKIGISTGRGSIFALMDVSPSKEIENEVKEVLVSIPGVEGFEDLKLRRAGPYIFGEANVKIRKFLDVGRAHEISERIERQIKDKIDRIDSFSIHIEPYKKRIQKLVIPVRNNDGLNSKIMNHFGRANHFMFLTIKEGEVQSLYTRDNPHKTDKVRAGLSVAQDILKEKVDVLITRQIGEISIHDLRDHFIDVYLTERKVVRNAIDDFIRNKLEQLMEPTRKMGTEQFQKEI